MTENRERMTNFADAKHRHHSLIASRFLAILVLGNFLTMWATAVFSPAVSWTPEIWLFATFCSAILMRVRYVRRPMSEPNKRLTCLILIIALVAISVPRIPYLLAMIPRPYNFAIPAWDDWAHVAELVSMTASPHYPLRFPFNPSYLFSYYYASLYPAAVLKILLPFLSLEATIFVSTLGYALAIGLSVIEVSSRLFRSARTANFFVAMFLLAGSFGYIPDRLVHVPLISMHMLWQQDVFLRYAPISPFLQSLFWVPQHMLGFYAIVLSWVVATQLRLVKAGAKPASLVLLLAAAFYTSPFTFLPLLFFLATRIRLILLRLWRHKYLIVIFVLFCVPPFLVFLGKPQSTHFILVISGKHLFQTSSAAKWFYTILGFPVWFVMVSLIDLLGLPLLLLLTLRRRLGSFERDLAMAMLIFFASTYIIGFTNANNYSVRGMFLPQFVVMAVVLRQMQNIHWRWLRPDWRVPFTALPLMFIFSISGNIIEELWQLRTAVLDWSPMFNADVKIFASEDAISHLNFLTWLINKRIDPQVINHSRETVFGRDLAKEFNAQSNSDEPIQRVYYVWFIEKFQHLAAKDLIEGEKELMGSLAGQEGGP